VLGASGAIQMTRAITLVEAAETLCKTPRWLKAWLAENPVDEAGIPFYVPMGRTKIFEISDVARIREHIRRSEQCRLKSIGVEKSGIVEARLALLAVESSFDAHCKPRIKTSQRARLPRSKRNTGTVISMDRRQS
jgi:hypothetical protein